MTNRIEDFWEELRFCSEHGTIVLVREETQISLGVSRRIDPEASIPTVKLTPKQVQKVVEFLTDGVNDGTDKVD